MRAVTIGKHNPRLAEVRQALRRGGLTPDGMLAVEGPHLVEEAVRSGLEITGLFLSDRESATGRWAGVGAPEYVVSAPVFRSITGTRESRGVLALVRPPRFGWDEVLGEAGSSTLLIVLCRLQDPGNAGTILRLAEAFEARGCLATPGTASRFNPKFVRASAGALFRIPQIWEVDPDAFAARARAAGLRVLGSGADGDTDVDRWDWSVGSALLVGNEGEGLDRAERSVCDRILRIPHSSSVESLNAAGASAVCLYEAHRQRRLRTA
jgi:TrmH family RNA methyltransferase